MKTLGLRIVSILVFLIGEGDLSAATISAKVLTKQVSYGGKCVIVIDAVTNVSDINFGGESCLWNEVRFGSNSLIEVIANVNPGIYSPLLKFADGSVVSASDSCTVVEQMSGDLKKAGVLIAFTNIGTIVVFVLTDYLRNRRERRQKARLAFTLLNEAVDNFRLNVESNDRVSKLPDWLAAGDTSPCKATLLQEGEYSRIVELRRLQADWESGLLGQSDAITRVSSLVQLNF